jgi:hypothetical protein
MDTYGHLFASAEAALADALDAGWRASEETEARSGLRRAP